MFEFDSDDLKEIFINVDPGNTAITLEMKDHVPGEIMMTYGKTPQRLCFHVQSQEFEDHEKEKILEFKNFCKTNGHKIP